MGYCLRSIGRPQAVGRFDGYYYSADLFNLHSIETLAALVATNVIIIHETMSTAGEIGVFGSNRELRDRIITLVPEKFSVEEDKLSSFLRLAFWNYDDRLMSNNVIRFYPSIKRSMISDTHSYYETTFDQNTIPSALGTSIQNQIVQKPCCSVEIIDDKINRYYGDALTIWLSYASIKHYLLSIISVSENRNKIRKCTKIVDIRNILKERFISIAKNTYYNKFGKKPKRVLVYVNNQPELRFDDVLSFMIYFWHACNIMKITCNEDKSISVSFPQNNRFIWEKYSELIKQVTFTEWGE